MESSLLPEVSFEIPSYFVLIEKKKNQISFQKTKQPLPIVSQITNKI